MLAPGLFAWAKFIDVPKDAMVFEVVGRQWNFNYRFPGADGVLGTVDARYVSDENPFGINPDDPKGQDDILISSPELHLPMGKPVKARASLDRRAARLHGAAIPGQDEHGAGTRDVCLVHAHPDRHLRRFLRAIVRHRAFRDARQGRRRRGARVHSVARQLSRRIAQTMAQVPGDAAAGQALYAVCAACHGAQGEGNPALNAPKLSGQSAWYLKRQLQNFKSGARGTADKDVFGKMMAPMAATLPDDAAIDNVVAYIRTLPDNPAPHTVTTDASNGKKLYETCAACHGADGRGRKQPMPRGSRA